MISLAILAVIAIINVSLVANQSLLLSCGGCGFLRYESAYH